MQTHKTLDFLKSKVDEIEDSLALERQASTERHEKLKQSHNDLARELSELKGGTDKVNFVLTVLSIVFALLSALTGWSFIRYTNFETVRQDVYEILGDVFQGQLADTIDQLTLVSPPAEQHETGK